MLDEAERERLLSGPVVVEEKLDGSNVWVAFDETGTPHAGGRSGDEGSDRAGHRGRLRASVFERAPTLARALPPDSTLYAEWMLLTHAIRYDRLPDYLIAVDISVDDGTFVDRRGRERICREAGLVPAPLVYEGKLEGLASLVGLHGRSAFGDEPAEGLIVRREEGGTVVARAKWVRPDYQPKTDEQWRAPPAYNRLGTAKD